MWKEQYGAILYTHRIYTLNLVLIHFYTCPRLVFILWINKGTGSCNTDTLTLFQTSGFVRRWAIFSAIFMSSGSTEPKTVYEFFHSSWFARLMKNSGPEPIHATEPLLMVGQSSVGIFLNLVPTVSRVPWINANGGPNIALEIQKRKSVFWVANACIICSDVINMVLELTKWRK